MQLGAAQVKVTLPSPSELSVSQADYREVKSDVSSILKDKGGGCQTLAHMSKSPTNQRLGAMLGKSRGGGGVKTQIQTDVQKNNDDEL